MRHREKWLSAFLYVSLNINQTALTFSEMAPTFFRGAPTFFKTALTYLIAVSTFWKSRFEVEAR